MAYINWGHETPSQRRARKRYEEVQDLYERAVHYARANTQLAELGVGGVAGSSYPPNLKAIEFVNKETPAGLIDGLNRVFYLSKLPIEGTDHLYMNGVLQDSDPYCDYSINENIIIFAEAPPLGSKLKCSYIVLIG